ncbi:hypothetical protein [Neobacillus drentensis]|uniref:hypothetical protein n=1 Tax=Neobacillus drentensis TaxID=220684 RepID=UPI002FFDB04C
MTKSSNLNWEMAREPIILAAKSKKKNETVDLKNHSIAESDSWPWKKSNKDTSFNLKNVLLSISFDSLFLRLFSKKNRQDKLIAHPVLILYM